MLAGVHVPLQLQSFQIDSRAFTGQTGDPRQLPVLIGGHHFLPPIFTVQGLVQAQDQYSQDYSIPGIIPNMIFTN